MTYALIVLSVLLTALVFAQQLYIHTQRKAMDVLGRQADYYYRRLRLYEEDDESAGCENKVI